MSWIWANFEFKLADFDEFINEQKIVFDFGSFKYLSEVSRADLLPRTIHKLLELSQILWIRVELNQIYLKSLMHKIFWDRFVYHYEPNELNSKWVELNRTFVHAYSISTTKNNSILGSLLLIANEALRLAGLAHKYILSMISLPNFYLVDPFTHRNSI